MVGLIDEGPSLHGCLQPCLSGNYIFPLIIVPVVSLHRPSRTAHPHCPRPADVAPSPSAPANVFFFFPLPSLHKTSCRRAWRGAGWGEAMESWMVWGRRDSPLPRLQLSSPGRWGSHRGGRRATRHCGKTPSVFSQDPENGARVLACCGAGTVTPGSDIFPTMQLLGLGVV